VKIPEEAARDVLHLGELSLDGRVRPVRGVLPAVLAGARAGVERVVKAAPEWDGRVCVVQVTDATERAMQVRILISGASSGDAFDLRCRIRERLLAFLAREYPDSLPRVRLEAEQVSQPRLETVD